MSKEKRQGGAIIERDGKQLWLVLTESTGEEGKGYKHNCGETLMEAKVYHPIWDGPFKCSGGGEVHIDRVPYCPQCEIKPPERGAPIDVPFPGVPVKI